MLGISSATLRRLARGYEADFGELPTDGAGGRLYPDHALDLMSEARELVKSRRVGTLEQAFKVLADGKDIAPVSNRAHLGLEAVVAELVALRQAMERQAEEIRELKTPTLPAPAENGQGEYVARLEQLYAEADKRAQYAMEELKRRDLAQPKRRGWWLWGRR